MLAEALPHDAFLVCKLHPSFEERETCEALLSASLPSNAFKVVGESDFKTPDLLAACDVAVMNELSMSLADTIVMGRPAIAISHPEFPSGSLTINHSAWAFKEAWWLVRDTAELRRALMVLTRDEHARQAQLSHRRTYIERFLVASDGRATQRVADLVEHLGAGKDPGCFVPSIGKSLLAE